MNMTMRSCSQHSFFQRKGSALLVVLWVVGFLSFLVITSMMMARQDMETVAARKMISRARNLAEMGVAIAAHPKIKAGESLLNQQIGAMESFQVSISTEEARLNLNKVLSDEEHARILVALFQSWGMMPGDAQQVVNALMDWVDEDELQRLNGAEREKYAQAGLPVFPANRGFRHLDEATSVMGFESIVRLKPDWRSYFTLWGGGRLDVNEASAELISLAADLPTGAVEGLVSYRNGPDGQAHTQDDQRFNDIDDVKELLGIAEEDSRDFSAMLTTESRIRRIESRGFAGEYSLAILVIMEDNGTRSRLLSWTEAGH